MNDTVSRKYVFVLCSLAVAVLAAGTVLKPKKAVPDPPSPSEMASLQARVRRDELGETAAFFAQRAQVLAQAVVYDPLHDSSAVAWEKNGRVLGSPAAGDDSHDPPLVVSEQSEQQVEKPPSLRLAPLDAGRWLLVVGRTADGETMWAPALYGGTRQTTCAGEIYRELIVNARLDRVFSGAGVFDLEGMLAGVVANCEGSYHLVSAASIPGLLKAFGTADRRIAASYGFQVSELTADAKRLFSLESGLFVKSVRQGDVAELAGLQAGDVIKTLQAQALTRVQELWKALESEDDVGHVFEILRNGRGTTVRMPSVANSARARLSDSLLGMRILSSSRVLESLYVDQGTPAYKAGLRTGDRLIQVGDRRTVGAAGLARAISSVGDKPLLVVYERDGAQEATLVSR